MEQKPNRRGRKPKAKPVESEAPEVMQEVKEEPTKSELPTREELRESGLTHDQIADKYGFRDYYEVSRYLRWFNYKPIMKK